MAVTINPESEAYLRGVFSVLCWNTGKLERIFTHHDHVVDATTVALEIRTKSGNMVMVKIGLPVTGALWDEPFFEMARAKIALEASE